VQDIIHEKEMR